MGRFNITEDTAKIKAIICLATITKLQQNSKAQSDSVSQLLSIIAGVPVCVVFIIPIRRHVVSHFSEICRGILQLSRG
jgi:hypothetical protein